MKFETILNKMIRITYLIFILSILCSCSSEKSTDLEFEKEITKRIEILNNSYKFKVIPINLQGNNFDKLKIHIDNIVNENLKTDINSNYDSISGILLDYEITILEKPDSREKLLFNILLGLDDLIFKYVPSRLNFSDYKMIVVPDKYDIKSGDTLKAKIYLTVSDSLYEPEFKVNMYYLPSNNGVGEYNMVASSKGQKKVEGVVIYSNEYGSKDTLEWNYKFEIK